MSAWDLYFQRTDREEALRRLRQHKTLTNEEMRLRCKDGSPVWLLANRALNERERPAVIEGSFVDISAQKRAEADLRSLLNICKTLNTTLETSSLMDILITGALRLADAETGWSGLRTLAGIACHQCFHGSQVIPFEYCWPPGVGWGGWVQVHRVPYLCNDVSRDRVIVPAIRDRFGIKSGMTIPLIDSSAEVIGFFEVINKRGRVGFTKSDVEKMTAISQVASVVLQNVLAYQEIQRNEEKLRQLSARMLRLQDEERRRLARELHDSTGQVLATLALKIGATQRALCANPQKAAEGLAESAALAKQCSDDLRSLTYLLHPPLMDEVGLDSALRFYAQGFAKRSGIFVDLDLPEDLGRLPEDVETTLFRTVQEGLTNVQLHAESRTAEIRIISARGELILEIKDQGRGMPAEATKQISAGVAELGVGIGGMRERVQQLGGQLVIDSGRQGTTVRVTLPIERNGASWQRAC